jgi:hypothetical protein
LWLIHIDPDNFMRVLLSAIASRGDVQWILALAAKVVAPQVWDQQSVLRTRPEPDAAAHRLIDEVSRGAL